MDRATNRARGGFTLIELLVVMAIIAVLAGLVVASVSKLRSRALVATATTQISSLEGAVNNYRSSTTIFPNAGAPAPKDDPEGLFRALCTGNPRLGGDRESYIDVGEWPEEQIGVWPGSYRQGPEAQYDKPSPEQLDFSGGDYTPLVLLDPWGHPYHYVEWDSHPRNRRQLAGGQFRARGNQKFAIWSDGPNGINEWGEGDDVTSWK
ncbi:MAG: prepilin-type N-terminal cleavage/methylation domain-containing protein [Planctomycetota bacterium]|nr:MAG: prepilin-type N-terminal cleavage/methylation domain-containing protein [Planctomycetota bacterium]